MLNLYILENMIENKVITSILVFRLKSVYKKIEFFLSDMQIGFDPLFFFYQNHFNFFFNFF
jgi:hypothetical protein